MYKPKLKRMDKKPKKSGGQDDRLNLRIDRKLKYDFEQISRRHNTTPSENTKHWISEYVELNKYRYFEVKNKYVHAIVRAVSENYAISQLVAYYYLQKQIDLEVQSKDVSEISTMMALTMFVLKTKEFNPSSPLISTNNAEYLIELFENTEIMLIVEENLYYVTTKEQIEVDMKKKLEEELHRNELLQKEDLLK